MESTLVNLDCMPDVAFECYVTGEHWNGFVPPFFPRHVAEAVLRLMFHAGHIRAFIFNDYTNCVHVEYNEPLPNGTEDVVTYKPVQMEGIDEPLWPIGSWEWVWFDVSEEWDKSWESDWWEVDLWPLNR